MHLGESARLVVYGRDPSTPSGFKFIEIRRSPAPGGGKSRWVELADTLHDCRALLVNASGPSPRSVLEERGISVIEMEGLVEEGLAAVYDERPIPATLKRRFSGCSKGTACRGTGTGCA
jgi:nitrogen fixation protein NifB